MGGLGLAVAHWMVQQGARHIILMGRTQLPPRSHWNTILPEDRLYPITKTVRAIEERGAIIHLAAADVSDAIELKNCRRKDLGVSLPLVKLLQGLSIAQLAHEMLDQIDPQQLSEEVSQTVLSI